MNQQQSRKALAAILVLGAVLLSAPLLWHQWTVSRETVDKTKAFGAVTARPLKDVFSCLVHRPEGGLKLDIVTQNHFSDSVRGIAVKIEAQGKGSRLEAWIAKGNALTAGETAQLQSCAAS